MLLNIILVAVGLIICFGGIYLRRVCSALVGFVWGCLCAVIVLYLVVGLGRMDQTTMIIVLAAGVVFALLCAIFQKICAAVNGFLTTASVVLLLLFAFDVLESELLIIAIAVAAGILVAVLSVKFFDYSFIITTALAGGFIASLGGAGLINGDELEETMESIVYHGGRPALMVFAGTIVLGILGFIVQLRRLRRKKDA